MKEPTPEQKKMIERALKESIEEIVDAAETTIGGNEVRCVVLLTAQQRWRERYAPMVRDAVVKYERNWETDRKLVLERARQVGRVAANMATIRSVIFSWILGEIGKPGQHVHVGDASRPEITIGIAELASRCIDCLHPKPPGENEIRWDWCRSADSPPLPGLNIERVSTPPKIPEILDFLYEELCLDINALPQLVAERKH